jgi:hypothetical protein
MFFRPKSKPPLAQVEALVQAASLIVEAYWRDDSYRPADTDLRVFLQIEQRVTHLAAWTRRLTTRLERRARGESEINQGGWERSG